MAEHGLNQAIIEGNPKRKKKRKRGTLKTFAMFKRFNNEDVTPRER